MPSTPDPSSRFRKAALTERDRLLRQRHKADSQVSQLRGQLEEAEDRLHHLDERISTLQALVGEPIAQAAPVPGEQAENGAGALRGARIRELAVRTLLESGHAENPIHYRAWLELLEQAGYRVDGKRPDAVFLNQIVRSPVVRATTEAGVYELDLQAPGRLEAKLEKLQRELRDTTVHDALDGDDLEKLTLEIRRVERALQEATEILTSQRGTPERAAA
jgi:hypothetical protein